MDFSENTQVLVCSYQPYMCEAMAMLREQRNWHPKVWFVADENRDLVARDFAPELAYDYFDVVRGILPPGMSEQQLDFPSPEELAALSYAEFNFFYMLERNDSNYSAFNYKERFAFYTRMIAVWKSLLKQHAITLVLFEEEPHQASDYALYVTAKLLGVTTIMTTRTISELGVIPQFDYQEGFTALNDAYSELKLAYSQGGDPISIDAGVENYFGKLRGDYDKIVEEHLWDQVDEYKALSGSKNQLSHILKKSVRSASSVVNVIKKVAVNPAVRSDQIQRGRRLFESEFTYRQYLSAKISAIRQKKALRRIYDKKAISSLDNIPQNKRYIYLALQYQPEKSTCPLAGRFVDQRYLIKWLASRLDSSWHILVKEHPSQFISSYTRFGECFRDESYYRDIDSLSNVSFISLGLDSFTVMETAEIVASAGGSVCWEAVSRGIPALSFANSWFQRCHGVFYINSEEALIDAFNEINTGFKPNLYLVKAFAQLIKNYGFSAAIGGSSSLKHLNIDNKANAEAHVKAITHLLN